MTTSEEKHIKGKLSSGKSVEGIVTPKSSTLNVIRLGNNENPFGASPKAFKAVLDYLSSQDPKKNNLSVYTEQFNNPLSTAIKRRFKEIDSAEVIVGNGLNDIIINIIRLILKPGDKAVVHTPVYHFYETIIGSVGAEITYVKSFPKDDFKVDVQKIIDSINENVKLVILCNPCNPTGNIFTWPEIKSIIDKASQYNAIVYLDEAYVEYSNSSYIDKVKDNPNLIVGRTFSKAYGMGSMRVGWGVISKELVPSYRKVQCPFAVSSLSSVAAQAALDDHDFLDKVIKNNNEGKKYLTQEFIKLGITNFTSYSNYLSFLAGEQFNKKAADLCNWCLKNGIVVKNAATLRDAPQDLVRVTIGLPEQNEKFVEVIAKKIKLVKLPQDFASEKNP